MSDGGTTTTAAAKKRKARADETADGGAAERKKGGDEVRPLHPARPRHARRGVRALGRCGGEARAGNRAHMHTCHPHTPYARLIGPQSRTAPPPLVHK